MKTVVASKTAPLAAGFVVALCSASSSASAQEAAQMPEVEEVIVTGTAIRGTPIDSPYAVEVLDREAYEDRGAPALTDLFKNLGANAGAIGEVTSWLNGTGQAVPETAANVNLRGLGASRTLVLFNGQRHVYVPARLTGGRFVDVNALPLVALKRVEVLKEGAAAVYGSDAVAGVVNFITRGDFAGFEVAGAYEHFDGAGDADLGAIWGGSLGDAHLVVAVERAERQRLNLAERSFGLPADGAAYWGWSGTGNPGAFMVPGSSAGGTEPLSALLAAAPRFVDPRCAEMGGEDWGGTCGFRFGPWDNLIESQQQTRLFGELSGDYGASGSYRVEMLWADAQIPAWLTTPTSPPVARYDDVQLVAADHPGRVALARGYGALPGSDGSAIDLQGTEDWYFLGRLVGNAGPGREVPRETRTLRLAASANGEAGALHYDLAVAWSRADGLMNRPAEYAYRRFLAFRGFGGAGCGVGVVADPAAVSGLALGPVPSGVAAGQENCRYYNPFSNAIELSAQPGSAFQRSPNPDYRADLANDPALFDWIGEEVRIRDEAELLVVDAVVGADWIPDRLSVAAGYQMRRFAATTRPSDVANLALNPCWIPGDRGCRNPTGLFASARGQLPFDADQTTHAAFVEWALKVGSRWDAQIAAHYERHDQASTFDPKLALRLAVSDALALRGSVQTTFRTPSVDDLNPDISTKLELLPAVGTFKAIETQGNPHLDPESALTFNLGAVLLAPSLEITADYWRYEFSDPVRVLPFRAIEAAYASPATRAQVQALVFCPGDLNDGSCEAAEVERIRVQSINGPGVDTSGVDMQVGGWRPLSGGELEWGASASYIATCDVAALALNGLELVAPLDAVGYLNDPVDPAVPPLPRWKTAAFATWRWRDMRLSGRINRVSAYEDRDRSAGDRFADIDAFQTVDLTLSWRFPERGLTVSLAALNVADEAPPLVGSDHFFDGMTHNPKGRRLKLRLQYRFGG